MSMIAPILILVVMVAMFLYLPRFFTPRQRVLVGMSLLLVGFGGLLAGMRLQDQPFLQNDIIDYCLLYGVAALMAAGLSLLVSWRR